MTIESGKEVGLVQINVIPKSLTLCQITAVDGDTVYLCTTPPLGGNSLVYNGNTYQARLKSNVIDQIQAQSPQGYDIPGSINLEITDGDFDIWLYHANLHGWRGGTLTVTFVLWDIPSNTFSTNAYVWTFILDKPNIDADGKLTVAGQARQSMTRLNVPNFARQNMCGQTIPTNAAQRLDGLFNPTSPYYGCGYSPDLVSLGGVGNATTPNLLNPDGSQLTDANGYYVMCDLTRSCGSGKGTLTQGCMARLGNYSTTTVGADGDLAHDHAGHATGHFTGDTWLAPVGSQGRQYVNPSAGVQYAFNAPNPATGQTYYNQGYGTQWVTATVLAPAGDPNSDRAECIVCMAPIGNATIINVLVNGVTVSQNSGDVLFTYYLGSAGGRTGNINADAIYDSQGDTHGSMCWIRIVVPVELQTSSSIPNVQVLVAFPPPLQAMPIATATVSGSSAAVAFTTGTANEHLASGTCYIQGNSGVPNGSYTVTAGSYGPPGTITITIPAGVTAVSGTGGGVFFFPTAPDAAMIDPAANAVAANPVWALLDELCMWGPFTAANIDVQTWYTAAQVCAVQIPYTDINGNAAMHARYRCSFVLQTSQRQSMAKAVLAIRNCAAIILGINPANGLLQVYIEETLADQQPSPITGSNYNTPIASVTAAGNPTLGSNITSSATTILLSAALLSTLTVIQIGTEQMLITGGQGTTSLTVTRGYGTTAASHVSGVTVFPCGFLAYLFDGGSATVAASIEKGTFKLGGRTLNDTPNTVDVSFQDSANAWVLDSCTTIDPPGYITSGNQEIQEALQMMGTENFDQTTRMSNLTLAKSLYGNSRFDAGGTELPSFRSTVRAAHLANRAGFIVGIRYDQLGI